ncbi:hypothetical protein PG987_013664 [Apiospora arundinis]
MVIWDLLFCVEEDVPKHNVLGGLLRRRTLAAIAAGKQVNDRVERQAGAFLGPAEHDASTWDLGAGKGSVKFEVEGC